MSTVEFWRGEFGDEYTHRNWVSRLVSGARMELFCQIFEMCESWPSSILEVGAGSGTNLDALLVLGREWEENWVLSGVEPNAVARKMAQAAGFDVIDGTAAYPNRTADLVFTSGVLIHISPSQLLPACQGIYNAADRYIVCIEYFSDEPEEKKYRGHSGKLWKRDFGSYWLDHFGLEPLGCGFAWKRMTGLDNLTFWVFRKC